MTKSKHVILSLHDTMLSPSCTVRCPGITESLVFLSIYKEISVWITLAIQFVQEVSSLLL